MRFLAVIFCLMSTAAAAAPLGAELGFRAHARAYVEHELAAGRHQDLAVHALDSLMAKAHARLRGEGFGPLVDELEREWLGTIRKRFTSSYDMGAHPPASEWVAGWYASVEAKLGVTVCEFLHLRDVFVINYGWPVVMNPHEEAPWCAETLAVHADDLCSLEYNRHFSGTKWQKGSDPYADDPTHWGVAPVAGWWATEIACEIGLWGSDGSFLCGSAASAVEIIVARYVGPAVAAKIWKNHND